MVLPHFPLPFDRIGNPAEGIEFPQFPEQFAAPGEHFRRGGRMGTGRGSRCDVVFHHEQQSNRPRRYPCGQGRTQGKPTFSVDLGVSRNGCHAV